MIRLRLDVFVVEQDCVYADLDGKDLDSVHLWSERSDAGPGEAAESVVTNLRRAHDKAVELKLYTLSSVIVKSAKLIGMSCSK